jgi:hypothetical protein
MKPLTSKISICLLVIIFSTRLEVVGQITSDKWPKATIKYYEVPRLTTRIGFIPMVGSGLSCIDYEAGAMYKLNNSFYLKAGIMKPLVDEDKTSKYSIGGEWIFKSKQKKSNENFKISEKQISSTLKEVKYRVYNIIIPAEKSVRFGIEYVNSEVEKKMLIYGGIGWRELSYFYVEMPDLGMNFEKCLTFNPYIDLVYSPYNKLKFNGTDVKAIPFGGRAGIEISRNKSYVGNYFKLETGFTPDFGAFFSIAVGISLKFEKLKERS